MESKMNKHLRELIHKHRLSRGLNFGELAELAGYQNRSKWANKICNLEREGVGTDEMVSRVIKALGIDGELVSEATQRDFDEWAAWADEPVPMRMIVRLIGPVCQIHDIPPEISSPGDAIDYARNYAMKKGFRVCLVLSRRESVWIAVDGTWFISEARPGVPNIPYSSLGGKKFFLDASQEGFNPVVFRNRH
jgi:hypothetical protein